MTLTPEGNVEVEFSRESTVTLKEDSLMSALSIAGPRLPPAYPVSVEAFSKMINRSLRKVTYTNNDNIFKARHVVCGKCSLIEQRAIFVRV
jgi:hypothetical protein